MNLLVAATMLISACSTTELNAGARAEQLRRSGHMGQAYGVYAEALCAQEGDFDTARDFVATWDALGRPGMPSMRLSECSVEPRFLAYIQGLALGAKGETEAADVALGRALRHANSTARAEVLYRRGLLWLSADKAPRALGFLEQAAAIDPERTAVRLALAGCRLKSGELARVAPELRGMLVLRPTTGEIRRGQKILAAATRASLPPLAESVESILQDALAAIERRDFDASVIDSLFDLTERVMHPRVLTVAGIAALSRGTQASGEEFLKLAAEMAPLDARPHKALGLSLLAAERNAQATAYLRKALMRAPLDVEVAQGLATAASSENIEVAREAYLALTSLQPASPRNFLKLARVERRLGHLHAAGLAIERGHAIDPNSVPLLVERAFIQAEIAYGAPTLEERRGAEELARASVRAIEEKAPGHPGLAPVLKRLAQQKPF